MSKHSSAHGNDIINWLNQLPDSGRFIGVPRPTLSTPLWKVSEELSQKNGWRHKIYWVEEKETGKTKSHREYTTKNVYGGSWKDNKRDGYGVMNWKGEQIYEGDWKEGKRHGEGVLWIKGKGKDLIQAYTGSWYEGERCGRGTSQEEGGAYYEGEWKAGKKHGNGTMKYSNGDCYSGEWAEGERNGRGVMKESNGNIFEGFWKDDLKEGPGAYFFFSSGAVLVGEWSLGVAKASAFAKAETSFETVKEGFGRFMREKAFPDIPPLGLEDPVGVFGTALRTVMAEREKREEDEREQEKKEKRAERVKEKKESNSQGLSHFE